MAHNGMVTSLDVLGDHTLLSVGLDNALCYWDLRALSSGVNGPVARTEVDGEALIKVASSGCPYKNVAAVSSNKVWTISSTKCGKYPK